MLLSPSEQNPVDAADWLELLALYNTRGEASLEELRSFIEIDGTLSEIEDSEEYIVDPGSPPFEYSEKLVAATAAEIERRTAICGPSYPFRLIEGVLVASRIEDCIPYVFCLLVADRASYSAVETQATRLFEHLVCDACKAYLGGEGVRFGFPRDTMPKGILDAIKALASLTGEKHTAEGYQVQPSDKDLGLDVAAWVPFVDKKQSQVQLYVQCATGADWRPKDLDCRVKTWGGIFYWALDPLFGLAIPYVVGDDEWERKCTGVLLVDRLRIATVLMGKTPQKKEISEWGLARISEKRNIN